MRVGRYRDVPRPAHLRHSSHGSAHNVKARNLAQGGAPSGSRDPLRCEAEVVALRSWREVPARRPPDVFVPDARIAEDAKAQAIDERFFGSRCLKQDARGGCGSLEATARARTRRADGDAESEPSQGSRPAARAWENHVLQGYGCPALPCRWSEQFAWRNSCVRTTTKLIVPHLRCALQALSRAIGLPQHAHSRKRPRPRPSRRSP